MTTISLDLERARDGVSASSAGGSPFLFSYGLTFFLTAILSFFLALPTVALIAMFQGAIAFPIAFLLEKRLATRRMDPDNPLRSLSVLLALSQALGLPALIAIYSLDPALIPLGLASLGGVHFLPYAWLHRSRVYLYLAVALSIGAFAIQLLLPANEFLFILLYVALIYRGATLPVYKNAARLIVASSQEGMHSTQQSGLEISH